MAKFSPRRVDVLQGYVDLVWLFLGTRQIINPVSGALCALLTHLFLHRRAPRGDAGIISTLPTGTQYSLDNIIILALGGLVSGILAGLFGIGGGTVLVPLLVAMGYSPLQSVATSTLAIVITAVSGTLQNWRMGTLHRNRILGLGIPALIAAQGGVSLAASLSAQGLLLGFGGLMLLNIGLFQLRQWAIAQAQTTPRPLFNFPPLVARVITGIIAGLLAGLFGVGGGAIMVPLQLVFLGEPLKQAIQTSLAVVVLTAISACIGYSRQGQVVVLAGVIVGLGGLMGAQVSTRLLPKLPDVVISVAFRGILLALAIYSFWRAANLQ
jgi:uncharacterized membrane protein YfcA